MEEYIQAYIQDCLCIVYWQQHYHEHWFCAQSGQFSSLSGSPGGSLTILRPILAHSAQFLSRHPSPICDLAATQLSVTGQRVMRQAMGRRIKRKEEKMPLFTIMHIFEVPARNQYEATDELMTARKHNYDKVYLKKVLVKDAEELKPFRHKVNVFEPKEETKMVTIFRRQLFGK